MWRGGCYILWGGDGLVRVVGVGELCLDASAFAEATADQRCLILDACKISQSSNIIGRLDCLYGECISGLFS